MGDLCHSEEAVKAPQMASQTALGADECASALWNCIKSLILYGKKTPSENDLIISLWKYDSGIINSLRWKSYHLITALVWKILNLRIRNTFLKMIPIHSHGCSLSFPVNYFSLPLLNFADRRSLLCKQHSYAYAVSRATLSFNDVSPLALSLKINHIYSSSSQLLMIKSMYFRIYTNVKPTLLCSDLLCICHCFYCLANLIIQFTWKICANV